MIIAYGIWDGMKIALDDTDISTQAEYEFLSAFKVKCSGCLLTIWRKTRQSGQRCAKCQLKTKLKKARSEKICTICRKNKKVGKYCEKCEKEIKELPLEYRKCSKCLKYKILRYFVKKENICRICRKYVRKLSP